MLQTTRATVSCYQFLAFERVHDESRLSVRCRQNQKLNNGRTLVAAKAIAAAPLEARH